MFGKITANVKTTRRQPYLLSCFGCWLVVIVIFSAFLINNKGVGKHDTL